MLFIKKIILLIFSIISIIIINNSNDYVIVPNESIRFRIIPSSNAIEDIVMKEKVKERINEVINNIESSKTIEESRINIISHMPIIEKQIQNLFIQENYNKEFTINYGLNYFPEKIYNGVKYESGEYESMVIEIGDKSGDNYWCVLFPPLCLIEAEENEEIEYSFFVKEIINKYIN